MPWWPRQGKVRIDCIGGAMSFRGHGDSKILKMYIHRAVSLGMLVLKDHCLGSPLEFGV